MSWNNFKIKRLQEGETIVVRESGNSMVPRIHSGQPHKLAPCTWEQAEVGDVVYCKVKGSYLTHLVKAKDATKGLQISNNKGRINGWTKSVYGKVIEVLPNK
jgi:hypothetical protein